MITIDGIQIHKVIEIECHEQTDFDVDISFYIDDRLEGTTDHKRLEDLGYKVFTYRSNDDDFIDYATVRFPNDDNFNIAFSNDNQG